MQEIIITILIILLLIAFFYILILKKSLKNLSKKLDQRHLDNSQTLITASIYDKQIYNIINSLNTILKENAKIKNEYEQKNQALQKMMTNISHDLRTPLTSALGYIDILLKSANSKEEENLKIIKERLKRLSELINSFFEFSKIISSSENIMTENINLVALLEKSISNYYDDFTRQNRKINFTKNIQKITTQSNEAMLTRVFDNLINNAYKYSTHNLNINLYVNHQITITFTNHLIDQNIDVNKIFDEFYTADISRTKSGTGLGLAIAKEFVNSLNGKIKATKTKDNLKIIITFDKD